eukprot:803774-Amphidinium_carterae.1
MVEILGMITPQQVRTNLRCNIALNRTICRRDSGSVNRPASTISHHYANSSVYGGASWYCLAAALSKGCAP